MVKIKEYVTRIEGGGIFQRSAVRIIWTSIVDLSGSGSATLTNSVSTETYTSLKEVAADRIWSIQWLLLDLKDRRW